MPKVSVNISVYNMDKYVEYALLSVLRQTFQDWECIIVNDGSTDDTEKIVKEYVKRDPRCKYVYQDNRGLAEARNAAIKSSTGEYIAFLDADDLWEPDMLEKTISYLDANPDVSIVSGGWDLIDEQGERIFRKRVARSSVSLEKLLLVNRFPVHAVLVRREVFQVCGPFDPDAVNDWDMWLRAASNGFTFGYIEDLIAHYRRHAGCVTVDIDLMRRRHLYVLDKVFRGENDPKMVELRPYAYILCWLSLADYCKEAKRYVELGQCIEEAEKIYSEVGYSRKYSTLIEARVESLPHNEAFLERIYLSLPRIWRWEAYTRRFQKRAIAGYYGKDYVTLVCNLLPAIILWPPRGLWYIKRLGLRRVWD